jgi:hypothetical protein
MQPGIDASYQEKTRDNHVQYNAQPLCKCSNKPVHT